MKIAGTQTHHTFVNVFDLEDREDDTDCVVKQV